MGEKAEAERERAGGSAAEGATPVNTENLGETNAPELQSSTYQETKSRGEVSTSISFTNLVYKINRESSGVMTHARRARMGVETERGGGAAGRWAERDGKSRGNRHIVVSINKKNRYANSNVCTDARAGDRQFQGYNSL